MGDRFTLTLDCAYCGESNKEVYYAPASRVYTFECGECRKENFISPAFQAKKLEDATLEDVTDGFSMTTTVDWSEEDIKRIGRECLLDIRKMSRVTERLI